jgi:hypothetical protein
LKPSPGSRRGRGSATTSEMRLWNWSRLSAGRRAGSKGPAITSRPPRRSRRSSGSLGREGEPKQATQTTTLPVVSQAPPDLLGVGLVLIVALKRLGREGRDRTPPPAPPALRGLRDRPPPGRLLPPYRPALHRPEPGPRRGDTGRSWLSPSPESRRGARTKLYSDTFGLKPRSQVVRMCPETKGPSQVLNNLTANTRKASPMTMNSALANGLSYRQCATAIRFFQNATREIKRPRPGSV